MKDAIELIAALTPLVWPILIAVVMWRLFPTLTAIIKSRSFSVKIAGMELSVQDAAEQLRNQIEDLQRQVIQLRDRGLPDVASITSTPERETRSIEVRPRVLWVDDNPLNNAFQTSQLQSLGIDVIQAISTDIAMVNLKNNSPFDAIISDMTRREGSVDNGQAGMILLKMIRAAGYKTPFLLYSSARYTGRNRDNVLAADKENVLAAGGDGATASPVELLEWVQRHVGKS